MEWQPIETAPKDGTRILSFREHYAEGMAVIYWSGDWREWTCVISGPWPYPTHWQPLPKAPE